MLYTVWPVVLIVASNVIYQICAKSVPQRGDPFASLTVTYAVAAAVCLVLCCCRSGGLMETCRKSLNAASVMFGLALVGLEAGFVFAYRAGWQVGTLSIVQSAFLAVILLFVGLGLYGEPLTLRKAAGMAVCLAGLYILGR